jgi:hypothetical protein
MAGSTKARITARERARAARARADAARAERDRAVEDAATAFFAAGDERGKLHERIAVLRADVGEVERRMGAQIARLTEVGEPAAWQRELLEVDETERKRLRALADGDATPPPEPAPAVGGLSGAPISRSAQRPRTSGW